MFDFQVLKEWCDIETVLVDDFQETGSEQVLFLPHNFTLSESKDSGITNTFQREGDWFSQAGKAYLN